MKKLEFGVMYSDLEVLTDPPVLAAKYEALGYDVFWMPDHVLKTRMDPFPVLAAVAQTTTRMKVGTSVSVLPYRHPYLLAKTAATVDILSHGRLLLGVGIGGLFHEFEMLEIDRRERGRVSEERLEILHRLLHEQNVTHEGKYHRLNDITLKPSPVQKPLPIWVGADLNDRAEARYSQYAADELTGVAASGVIAPGAVRRAARFGDGFLPSLASVPNYRRAQRLITQEAETFGRDPNGIEWGVFLFIYIDDNTATARKDGPKHLEATVGYTGLAFENAFVAASPEDAVAIIESYASLGITQFQLVSVCEPSQKVVQFERIASEILPKFSCLTP